MERNIPSNEVLADMPRRIGAEIIMMDARGAAAKSISTWREASAAASKIAALVREGAGPSEVNTAWTAFEENYPQCAWHFGPQIEVPLAA